MRPRFCPHCGAQAGGGGFCSECGRPFGTDQTASPPPGAPSSTTPTRLGPPAKAKSFWNHWATTTAILVLGGAVAFGKLDKAAGGSLSRPFAALLGRGIDGTYVHAGDDLTVRIRIDGSRGSIDMGAVRAESMRVERRGDTVSLSGGAIMDAQGNVVEASARSLWTGGDETNLFILGDDGQTLTSRDTDGQGKRMVFNKQP